MARVPKARQIRAQFDKGSTRTETLLDKEYLVVPVIAMVEGVRFGAGQTEPELGLASEFGDVPIAWANRPLVLNHPQVDKVFVSANTPDILEMYQFGVTMNPQLKDNKLHMEAWIDVARVKELGGEFEDTYNRIVDQKDVEVSVGFFSDLRQSKGKFKGQKYSAIWTNIKPDHLAVLSDGILGACSVADGCGIPRINKTGVEMPKPITHDKHPEGCTCGGHGADPMDTADEPVTQKGLKQIISELLKPFTQSKEEKALEAHQEQRDATQKIVDAGLVQLNGQSIHSSLMNNDVYKMIAQAVQKKFGAYCYLYGYTQDVAVFESYNYNNGGYCCQQININVSDSAVEFVGEPQEVILQTKIVPQTVGNEPTDVKIQENDMTTPNPSTPTPNPAPSNPPATPPTQPNPTTVTQAAPIVEKKVLTAQEYIDQAPAEIRDMLSASLKAQEAKKTELIKALTEHKTNKFTEEYLKLQTNEVLENMVALLPGDFRGQASPTNVRFQNSNEGSKQTVPAPKVFAARKTEAA